MDIFEKKFNIHHPVFWAHHRSGWKYVVHNMIESLHNPLGTILATHVETLVRENIPMGKSWCGFLHNTPYHPAVMESYGPDDLDLSKIVQSDWWGKYAKNCKGIFVLSNYIKNWLESKVDVEINMLYHPTEDVDVKFNFDKFTNLNCPELVFIGHWMRRYPSLYEIDAINFKKVMLVNNYSQETIRTPVKIRDFINDSDYDELLSKSIVFVDLYDSSANNVILDCVIRNTPIIVNRLPAIEEYLGRNYPLFFSNLNEVEGMLQNRSRLLAAHNHMRQMNKEFININFFMNSVCNSSIYKKLKTGIL